MEREDLNHTYRNGGDIVEERESGRDLVSEMRLARSRRDVLANDLARMGWSESGDEPVHPDEASGEELENGLKRLMWN